MISSTPMGPGFFIFFRGVTHKGSDHGDSGQYGVFPKSMIIEERLDEPALRWKDIVSLKDNIEVISEDGEKYLIINKPVFNADKVIKLLSPDKLDRKILKVQSELNVTKKMALKIIVNATKRKINQLNKVRLSSNYSDDDLALILILSEV